MPDPKLKLAMEEVKAVLRKHDIAAVVILSSEKSIEYLHELSPSWSCCVIEKVATVGHLVRFEAMAKDFPNKAARGNTVQSTVSMVAGVVDALRNSLEQYLKLLAVIGKAIEHVSRHEPGGQRQYLIDPMRKTITCLQCGLTSHNPNDVENKYCGHCKIFHEP